MLRKNRKGISPLIATVLIIGFTVSLVVVNIIWGDTFMKNVTDNTDYGMCVESCVMRANIIPEMQVCITDQKLNKTCAYQEAAKLCEV